MRVECGIKKRTDRTPQNTVPFIQVPAHRTARNLLRYHSSIIGVGLAEEDTTGEPDTFNILFESEKPVGFSNIALYPAVGFSAQDDEVTVYEFDARRRKYSVIEYLR